MKPSQPMQVISHRLTSPRAPSTPPQSEHAPDKVDGKTPGSLSSREESAGTPTAREERRKAERECGKDYEATGFTHSVPYIYTVYHIYIYGTLYIYIWYTVCESCVLIKNPFGNALEVAFFPKRTEEAFGYRLWFKKNHGSHHLNAAGPQVFGSSKMLLFFKIQPVVEHSRDDFTVLVRFSFLFFFHLH